MRLAIAEAQAQDNSYKASQNAVVSPKTWNNQANDLLGIGQDYWLGGSSANAYGLWYVYRAGVVYYFNARGLRACVSLNSGITIDTSDTSKDGSTLAKAYRAY